MAENILVDAAFMRAHARSLRESQDDRDQLKAENELLRDALKTIEHYDAVDVNSTTAWVIVADACYEIPFLAAFEDKAHAEIACAELNRLWDDSDCEIGARCFVEPGRVGVGHVAIWNHPLKDAPETMPDVSSILNRDSK